MAWMDYEIIRKEIVVSKLERELTPEILFPLYPELSMVEITTGQRYEIAKPVAAVYKISRQFSRHEWVYVYSGIRYL